ncbi:MAG: hypothetical protein DMF38_01960 [Verrucomicrobia bacterium]|nr:MAG: hypothetical protein DMF38_01960 [Verrucomicrobiota bacterium]
MFRQWLRPRIQRLVILPRQNPLRLEVLELLDSCPQVNGICVLFWSGRMPHSSCKLRLLMRRRQANSTFWLAFVGVTVPAYEKISTSLSVSNDNVEVACGCMVSREPFPQLLSQIQDGRFDDYLSRPP